MAVQTPEYWKEERFQPLIEETTALGNKVLIPQKFLDGWKMERLRMEFCQKQKLPLMVGLAEDRTSNPIYYDMARVFYEIYPKHP